jgi:hypothetical protein
MNIILFYVIKSKNIEAKLLYININIYDIIIYIMCYIYNLYNKKLSKIF